MNDLSFLQQPFFKKMRWHFMAIGYNLSGIFSLVNPRRSIGDDDVGDIF